MSISDEEYFKEILNSLNKKDSEFLQLGYNFAKEAHKGQKRKSGEEYFIHPLYVGVSLWKRFKNLDLTIAGFLHDTVEDCESVEISQIYEKFGKNVGFMVDSVTKGNNTFYKEDEVIEDIKDKMIAGGMRNIGCILLKLADREHNLATLNFMPADKQVKKSFESQSLYIPLMHILGFSEKENLSISKCQELFKNYLKENNLKDYKQIKIHLLNICFKDFNEELFDIVYKDISKVVWEIRDKLLFKKLLDINFFDKENIDLIRLEGDLKGKFKAIFKIYGGNNFLNLKGLSLAQSIF